MPRDDDWESDADRPRRRRDYDDDYDDDFDIPRLRRGPRSGAVTAVGIINLILGSLYILLGICLMLLGAILVGAAKDAQGQPGGAVQGPAVGIVIVVALLVILVAVLSILAGIGLLNRRGWARIMTLILGGLSVLGGPFGIFVFIRALQAPDPARAPLVLGVLVGMFISIGYAVMVFVILLNPVHAEEFE